MRRALLIVMATLSLGILIVGYVLNEQRYSVGARRSQAVAEMAENWNGEIQFTPYFDALAPASPDSEVAAGSAAEAGAFDPSDEYWGLPRNEGYELVAGYCAACHSMQLVMQQRRSVARWDELVDLMVATQGMPAPPADDRRALVNYLGRNFGEETR